MPITKHYMGYYSPDEYEYTCDICGHTIDEDAGVQENDIDYCDKCYKEKMEEEKDVGD